MEKLWRFLLMKMIRASYMCLSGFTQMVSGYSLSTGPKEDRREHKENYEKSAHVIQVKLKNRKFELEGPELTHFVLR